MLSWEGGNKIEGWRRIIILNIGKAMVIMFLYQLAMAYKCCAIVEIMCMPLNMGIETAMDLWDLELWGFLLTFGKGKGGRQKDKMWRALSTSQKEHIEKVKRLCDSLQ